MHIWVLFMKNMDNFFIRSMTGSDFEIVGWKMTLVVQVDPPPPPWPWYYSYVAFQFYASGKKGFDLVFERW